MCHATRPCPAVLLEVHAKRVGLKSTNKATILVEDNRRVIDCNGMLVTGYAGNPGNGFSQGNGEFTH